MGDPKLSLVAISSMLLLLSSVEAVFDSGGEKASGDSVGSSDSRLEWQTLTKSNFSSQIRLHPHILIMVTVPWSGESRSLMKEIKNLVVVNGEELHPLRLMVVYRNLEKMLADVLGASVGINILYYHHSTPYKYHGRLRAQKILSSVRYIMSLKHEEVPFKSLNTQEDLENFLQSTDRSILLLEFCGWSAKFSHQKGSGNYETSSLKNLSQNVDTLGGILTGESNGKLEPISINEKVMDNEELTYGVEDLLTGSPWKGGFALANQSVLQQTENKDAANDTGMSCTVEEFQHFESFFTKFSAIAREYFLLPERQRFALISERSLLPFLGVNPEKWLLMIKFSGCPDCSIVVEDGDDLRTILHDHHSLIKELDVDGNNVEAAFPANRPSIVLFVDRSTELSKVQEESKLALEALRKFAWHTQLNYQMDAGVGRSNSATSSLRHPSVLGSKRITDPLSYQAREGHHDAKNTKIKDNMSIMIVNNGETISLKNTDHDNKGNSLYDILAQLLHQAKPKHETKVSKMSLLAKEVGFQLLSEDFDVQSVDSFLNDEGIDQSYEMMKSVATNAKDKSSEILENDFGHSIGTKNDQADASDVIEVDKGEKPITANMETDLLSKILQNASPEYIEMSNVDLVDATGTTVVDEGNKPEHTDMETDLEEQSYCTEGNGGQLADTLAEEVKVETSSFRSSQANGRSKSSKQEKSESFIHQNGKSFQFCQESINPEEDIRKDHADNVDGSSDGYSRERGQSSGCSSMSFDGDGEVPSERSILVSKLDCLHDDHQPFVGSFYFSDGGYQLLRSLTAGSKIPSLVILDPIQQQHFVFSMEADINYSSVVNFVDKFLNGNLTPYQRSASPITRSKDSPRPPFVNLDYREANSIPQVTASTFCELVIGSKTCEVKNEMSFINSENYLASWNMDVLVLFSSPWCGFCQRMELIVREVYRTFKSFMTVSNNQAKEMDPLHLKDNFEEFPPNGSPSIYLMDCTRNDCRPFVRSTGMEELYPTLLLFPAENKTAISYEGDMSVINIFEFLESHGSNVRYLNKHKGFIWTQTGEQGKKKARLHDIPVPVQVHEYSETVGTFGSNNVASHVSEDMENEGDQVVVGSLLTASYKLVSAVPFDNSTVLIVSADQTEGFHGVIINKRISWEILKDSYNVEALINALLFYGGPVSVRSIPFVSLTRKSVKGYIRVTKGVYFGNPVATGLVIESIKAGDQTANEFWFFFGYSSWGYNQLFDELNEGLWHLSEAPVEHLDWPLHS